MNEFVFDLFYVPKHGGDADARTAIAEWVQYLRSEADKWESKLYFDSLKDQNLWQVWPLE